MNEQKQMLTTPTEKNLDSLFDEQETEISEQQGATPTEYSKEGYAAAKKAELHAAYDKADRTAQAISSKGEYFKNYLNTLSRIEKYSPTNTLLIYSYRPNATRLREYDEWSDDGISVKANEKSISIIKRVDYQREDGTMGYNNNVKKVFDISQTNATPQDKQQHSIRALC